MMQVCACTVLWQVHTCKVRVDASRDGQQLGQQVGSPAWCLSCNNAQPSLAWAWDGGGIGWHVRPTAAHQLTLTDTMNGNRKVGAWSSCLAHCGAHIPRHACNQAHTRAGRIVNYRATKSFIFSSWQNLSHRSDSGLVVLNLL